MGIAYANLEFQGEGNMNTDQSHLFEPVSRIELIRRLFPKGVETVSRNFDGIRTLPTGEQADTIHGYSKYSFWRNGLLGRTRDSVVIYFSHQGQRCHSTGMYQFNADGALSSFSVTSNQSSSAQEIPWVIRSQLPEALRSGVALGSFSRFDLSTGALDPTSIATVSQFDSLMQLFEGPGSEVSRRSGPSL